MSVFYLSADLQRPSDGKETCFSLGYQNYAPIEIDAAGNASESASLVCASNTRGIFKRGKIIYKLLNRQNAPTGSVMCKSTNQGATWQLLDGVNSPAAFTLSGFYDSDSGVVICAFNNPGGDGGAVNFVSFNLITERWGAVFGIAGAPAVQGDGSIAVWKRPDNTLLVLYQNRNDFNPAQTISGIGAGVFDLTGMVWVTSFDAGGNIHTLPSWDSSQTLFDCGRITSVMDASGMVHLFMNSTSTQLVPVIWENRCMYQAIRLDNSLGSFFDFPGQVAPLTGGTQDLVAFSGSPLGVPAIVNGVIVLPVLNTNRINAFPAQLANVYLGSPVSNPVWSKDATKTIDPDSLIDATIRPQESPMLLFDGVSLRAIFGAAGSGAQVLYRVRVCESLSADSPADGWRGSTALDVANFPAFNFGGQSISTASFGMAPDPQLFLDQKSLQVVVLPDPTKKC